MRSGVFPETDALFLFFWMLTLTLCLHERTWPFAGLAIGLSLGVHPMGVLGFPIVLIAFLIHEFSKEKEEICTATVSETEGFSFLDRSRRMRKVLVFVLLIFISLSAFIYVPVRGMLRKDWGINSLKSASARAASLSATL